MKINFKVLYEFYRFIFIGILTVLLDAVTYFILSLNFELSYEFSKRVGFIVGSIFSFYMNRSFVFNIEHKKINHYLKFIILYFCSFFANSLSHDYTLINFNLPIFSFLIATAISTIMNFLGLKFIVFNNKK